MLTFSIAYSEPINHITGERSMKIRQYEIKDHEWTIVHQLQECLEVNYFFFLYYFETDFIIHVFIDI